MSSSSYFRRHIASLLLVATSAALLHFPAAHAADFPDVPNTNPSYKAIQYFSQTGVIEGYTDKNTGIQYFKPNQPVNRAEAVKMLLAGSTKAYSISSSAGTVFPDVKAGEWYTPYVAAAKSAGIVKGNDATGLFDPARTVNKAELMKMVVMANGIDLTSMLQNVRKTDLIDVKATDWFYDFMRFGKAYSIIFPDSYANLDPGKALTRAEVADILYNTVKIIKGGEVQQLLSRTESGIFGSIAYLNIKQYDAAMAEIEEAKRFAELAKARQPNEPLVEEAYTIAQSYAVALTGYIAWKRDGNVASANATALDAERLLTGISKLTELKAALQSVINDMKAAK